VKIGFIDFQGLWEGRETVLSFSALSTDRHFHGRLKLRVMLSRFRRDTHEMSSCSLDESAAKYLRSVSSGRGQFVSCDCSLTASGTKPCKRESAYRTRGARRRLFGIAGPTS
jgi:hypothetical protein